MRLRIVRIQTEDRLELQRRIARPIGPQITLRSLIMRPDFPRLRALGKQPRGAGQPEKDDEDRFVLQRLRGLGRFRFMRIILHQQMNMLPTPKSTRV